MAVRLLQTHDVSDLCIGKPALRWLPPSSTVADAVAELEGAGTGAAVAVWDGDKGSDVAGRVCMADALLFLCAGANLASPAAALHQATLSDLLAAGAPPPVRRIENDARLRRVYPSPDRHVCAACAGGSGLAPGRRALPRRAHPARTPRRRRALLAHAGGRGALLPRLHRALLPDRLPLRLRPRRRPPGKPRRRRREHRALRRAAPPRRGGVALLRRRRRPRAVVPAPPRRGDLAVRSLLLRRVRGGGHRGALGRRHPGIHRLGRRPARGEAPRRPLAAPPPQPPRHARPPLRRRPLVLVFLLRLLVLVLFVRRRRRQRQELLRGLAVREAREARPVLGARRGKAAGGGGDRVPQAELAGGGDGAGHGAPRDARVGGGGGGARAGGRRRLARCAAGAQEPPAPADELDELPGSS